MKKYERFTLEELENMETISQGHMEDLKFDNGSIKIWLSRMTKEDGMPYDNQVTVEFYNPKNYKWETIDEYEAR
jgi:hypothetical protein